MLMQIDGTFIFVAISFIIFMFIMKAILFYPVVKTLDERQSFYSKNEKMKNESKEKTKNLIEQKNETLAKTKEDASKLLKETLEGAKRESNIELKRVKQYVKDESARNKEELLKEQKQAKEEIKTQMSVFVNAVISKLTGENTNITVTDEALKPHLNI